MHYTKEDIAKIDELSKYAIDHTYWTISCEACYTKTDHMEYPEGQDAFELGFRVVYPTKDTEYVMCADCIKAEAWKKWD